MVKDFSKREWLGYWFPEYLVDKLLVDLIYSYKMMYWFHKRLIRNLLSDGELITTAREKKLVYQSESGVWNIRECIHSLSAQYLVFVNTSPVWIFFNHVTSLHAFCMGFFPIFLWIPISYLWLLIGEDMRMKYLLNSFYHLKKTESNLLRLKSQKHYTYKIPYKP